MNLLNPKITVQNAEGHHWLLTFEHAANNGTAITFTMPVAKGSTPLPALADEAIDAAITLLQRLKSTS